MGDRARAVLDEARSLASAGMRDAAIDLCKGALRDAGADLLAFLASLEQDAGLYGDSRKHFARAFDASASAVLARDLAWANVFDGREGDAHRVLDRAMRRWADSDVLIGAKAELLHHAGRSDEAWTVLRPALDREPNDPSVPIAYSFVAPGRGESDRAIGILRSAIGREEFDPRLRTYMRFRVGALLDRAGRYDEAWDEFVRANGEVGETFDADRFESDVDVLIRDWGASRVAGSPRPKPETERPVFVVGLPRSGTSLTEQILGAHPAVHRGGETSVVPRALRALAGGGSGDGVRSASLDESGVDAAARDLDGRYRSMAPGAKRVTDKLPENVMHLGMISMLLPAARVIVCRRDPMDTCLSCFFQNFRAGSEFAYDLEDLGRYARTVARLTDHWLGVLRSPIYELSYERLVEDQESVTRELVEFLGLPWDQRCLRFYESDRMMLTASVEQVRRPINRESVGRWRRYERHLEPLRRALGDYDRG